MNTYYNDPNEGQDEFFYADEYGDIEIFGGIEDDNDGRLMEHFEPIENDEQAILFMQQKREKKNCGCL